MWADMAHFSFSIQKCLGVCVLSPFSHVCLFATPWTVAHQAPLSKGFSRQEYWSWLLCPPPGDLPNPGTEPESLMSPALAGVFFISSATWEAPEMRPCLVWYILIRLKSKMFLEVLFLNNPKIQESANKEMFCFSQSGETMHLFSSILFYHIRSLNEGQVASLLQKYLMGKLNPPS